MTKPEELISLLEAYDTGLIVEEIAFHMKLSIGSVPSAVSRARKVCPKGKTIRCHTVYKEGFSRSICRSYYQLVWTGA